MSDRPFEPTPEKLRKARKEGKTQRSQLFTGAFLCLSVVYGIRRVLRNNWVRIELLLECLWSQEFTNAGECGRVAAGGCIQFVIILMIGILSLGVSILWFQVGNIWMPGVLAPDLKRISPSSGCARIFSSLGELPATVAKGLVATVGLTLLSALIGVSLLGYHRFFLDQQSALLVADLSWFLNVATLGLFCFGIADLLEKRRRYRQQVYMNHDEMKREQRESEGDPHLKAHRRSLHQAIGREEMIRQIKRSRVILVERLPVGEGR